MKLLIINNDSRLAAKIYSIIEEEYTLTYYDPPEIFDESSLAEFVNIRVNAGITHVFSVDYFPQISLACEVLGIKYISWIIDIQRITYYDYSIGNKCNVLYVSEYKLAEELSEHALEVHYLPMADVLEGSTAIADKHENDVLIWADIIGDTISISESMQELKDSTKGYIDGVIEQSKNNLSGESIYSKLPAYVRDDLLANYPLAEDSIELTEHKYDRLFFEPILERRYGFTYLCEMFAPWYEGVRPTLATNGDVVAHGDNLRVISRDEVTANDYNGTCEYKIVVVFPDISSGTLISQDMWNLMARGVFILVPEFVDLRCLGNDRPVTFRNTRQMDKLLLYYLSHESEREELAGRIRDTIRRTGGYNNRIKEIMGGIE